MSGPSKGGPDLVFNEDFDVEPESVPPPPLPTSTQAAPTPPAAPPTTTVVIPDVEEDEAVPAVSPEREKSEKEAKKETGSEVVLDFTDSTAVPVTTGTIQTADENPEERVEEVPEGGGGEGGRFGWLSVKPFLKYFDVDDKEVLKRLGWGLMGPFQGQFSELTKENPDLYGPFWIATTLVFLTAVSSNLESYTDHKHHRHDSDKSPPEPASPSPPESPSPGTGGVRNEDDKHKEWDGDYSKLGQVALLYYIYLFGVGVVFYFSLQIYNVTLHLSHIWCVYGYGMASWLPTVLLIALIQLVDDRQLADSMTILVAIVGTIYSALFIVRNFNKELQSIKGSYWALILVALGHLIIGLLIALYFH